MVTAEMGLAGVRSSDRVEEESLRQESVSRCRQDRGVKVLLLCGGKGERLRPMTDSLPKPLVPIKDRPMLHYLIRQFESQGYRRFVVAVGYKAQTVVDYLKAHHAHLDIDIVDSGDADILQRMRDSMPYLQGDFIMCYGDTLADVNLKELAAFHRCHDGGVTITTFQLQVPFGVLRVGGSGRVHQFAEKPFLNEWINIGYYYFNRRTLPDLRRGRDLVGFLQTMIRRHELFAYKHLGIHITVNTMKELQDAEKNISRFTRSCGMR